MGARVLERTLDDMTLPQFRVLTLIATSQERASRLAEKAAVSRPSLTGLLDGLEARGWVARSNVEGDRRGVNLELTKAGKTALRYAERAMTAHLHEVLAFGSAEQAETVIGGLLALSTLLKERALALR